MALSKAGHAALAFIWLALAALASPVSLLALSPVYGAVGAYLPHSRLVSVTALVVLASAKAMRKWVPAWSMQFAPLVAASVPLLQEQLSRYSGWLGATYGPLLTESVTLLPLLALSMYAAASELDRLGWIASSRDGEDDSGGNEGRGGAKARRAAVKLGAGSPEGGLMETVPVMAAYISFSFVEKAGLTTLPSVIGSHVVLSRVNLQLLLANLYCLLSILYSTILPRRWLGQSLPLGGRASTLKNVATYALIAYTLVYNPHRIGNERILNRALERHGYELLDREESITGYVSVLHDRTSETKLLRCDHSLLGGEWILTADRKAEGMGQSEPVFAVFAMLEAVRLLHERGSAGGGEEALVMYVETAPVQWIHISIPWSHSAVYR